MLQIVREMLDKCVVCNPEHSSFAESMLKDGSNSYEKARLILKVFGPEMAKSIQSQKNILEKELQEFVRIEQKRIDDIVA